MFLRDAVLKVEAIERVERGRVHLAGGDRRMHVRRETIIMLKTMATAVAAASESMNKRRRRRNAG